MAFFFPEVYQDIDWETKYLFLDKELQQVVRDAALGKRLVDKLVRVVKKDDGDEIWVFVHIEVQGFYEVEFEKRMYVYNYRLFDHYDRPICSLAVLADDRKTWKPEEFRYTIWGSEAGLRFPVVKLLDYQDREQELENSTNPFAMIVLAYLKTRATRKDPDDRLQWKLRIFKLLYERGYSREDILELTRFLDWIMVLPEELEQRFDEAMMQFEEEQHMRYITSFERRGMEKGRQEGIQQGIVQGVQQGLQQGLLQKSRDAVIGVLHARFGNIPRPLITSITQMTDLYLLENLLTKAATVASIQDFQRFLAEESGTD